MSAPAAKIFNIKRASHLSELIDGGTGTVGMGQDMCLACLSSWFLPLVMLGHFTLSLDFEIANGQAYITMSFFQCTKNRYYIIIHHVTLKNVNNFELHIVKC